MPECPRQRAVRWAIRDSDVYDNYRSPAVKSMDWPTWPLSSSVVIIVAYLSGCRHYSKLPCNSVESVGYLHSRGGPIGTASLPATALDPNGQQINTYGLVRIFHFLGG